LVAAVFAAAGPSLGAILGVQLALGTAALGLVYVSARRAYGTRAAVAAVVLGGLTHALAFYTARLLPTVIAVFLAALAVERLQAAQRSPQPRAWLLAGGAVGLAAVARPDLLLLAPASLLLPGLRRLRPLLAFAAGCALMVTPVTLRNHAVSGEWVLVSTQGGITFWQGNNPAARGGFSVPEGFSGSIATQREEARALAGLPSSAGDAAVSRHWFRRGLAFLLEDPARAARLVARKASLALDGHEHGLEYAPHLDASPLRPLLPVSFGVLLALAAVRLVRRPVSPQAERPLLLLLAVEAAVLLAFYAAGRYRMTALPALLAVAGFGAAQLVEAVRTRAVAAPLAAVAAGAFVAFLPLPGRGAATVAREDAGALRDRGEAFLSRGDLPRARAELQRALPLAPRDPTLPLDLGKVEAKAGDAAHAESYLRQALTLAPGLTEAHLDLGAVLYLQGRLPEAARAFREALRLNPRSAEAANNLLGTLLHMGQREEAATLAREMAASGVPIDAALRGDRHQ
ncbi:MAG TPA: tetratricopeptide repeat protein, partial [Candidatus Polarisedimenticolaceae bacterium]|nr:tetratricopeptide repeat protein [Candidatus Polarisedimenticolaceae bacterium]